MPAQLHIITRPDGSEFAPGYARSKDPRKKATYQCWYDMRRRCRNPKHKHFHLWGGRGIKVCERWCASFPAFLANMGERPTGMEIDRWPDKNGNYEPNNCRWATRTQQLRNTRRNVVVTFRGKTACLAELAEDYGLNDSTVYYRFVRYGWSLERALTTPPSHGNRHGRHVISDHAEQSARHDLTR